MTENEHKTAFGPQPNSDGATWQRQELEICSQQLADISRRMNDTLLGSVQKLDLPYPKSDQASGPKKAPSNTALQSGKNQNQATKHAKLAKQTYAIRRKRAAIFGTDEIFGEPAWDILLDLYIAQGEQQAVSVSSACIGSAAPATTGLRWLGVLADHGLIVREHDPNDQRRILVRLTDHGLNAMRSYFESAIEVHRAL